MLYWQTDGTFEEAAILRQSSVIISSESNARNAHSDSTRYCGSWLNIIAFRKLLNSRVYCWESLMRFAATDGTPCRHSLAEGWGMLETCMQPSYNIRMQLLEVHLSVYVRGREMIIVEIPMFSSPAPGINNNNELMAAATVCSGRQRKTSGPLITSAQAE